jgi:hypothetical protein
MLVLYYNHKLTKINDFSRRSQVKKIEKKEIYTKPSSIKHFLDNKDQQLKRL